MRRVCVLGGGTAGVEAAAALVEEGAQVTLFEASPSLPQPDSGWQSLCDCGICHRRVQERLLFRSGVDVRHAEPALAVQSGGRVTTKLGRFTFDSVIISTGSRALHQPLQWVRKTGVHVLDGARALVEFNAASAGYSRLVLCGSGPHALEIAESLLRKGVKVAMVSRTGALSGHFNAVIRESVIAAAHELGLSEFNSRLPKVVGVERVEAVVIEGEVMPCDCVVVVPDLVPRVPSTTAALGRYGGVIVDSRMQSSVADTFAAGNCAEYTVGSYSRPIMLHSTAMVSGRVAGWNAAGRCFSFWPVGSMSKRLFGLSIMSAGLGLEEAKVAGFEAAESVSRSDDGAACSIVFESLSGLVLGIQVATPRPAAQPDALAITVSRRSLLSDLAFLETSGSTDISPMVEAAREGMRRWRRS